jgi:hypothetical protein
LKTKAHFSSSWTSWVEGGKGHEFLVAVAGVAASAEGVADDGIFIDAGQAAGLADAAAVLQVGEDGEGLRLGEAQAKQSGALAFGEAFLAGATGQHAALVFPIAKAHAQVALAAAAVVGALGILAAEQSQFVHGDTAQQDNVSVANASLGL